MKYRKSALLWWNEKGLEDQFYVMIENNDLIVGDKTRHPSTLTGKEIEDLYTVINDLK